MTVKTSEFPKLLTIKEVSEILRVTRVTLYHWRRSGRLKAYNVGPGCVRYKETEVLSLLNEKAAG